MGVYIEKLGNVKGRIHSDDPDTFIEISEHFSFMADGYRFHPAYKNKMWDGRVRMVTDWGEIPLGLWSDIVNYCESSGVEVTVDPRIASTSITDEMLSSIIANINPHIGGEAVKPYDYQVEALKHALEWRGSILLSPTSSGKSMIQYLFIRTLQMIGVKKVLLVVPTTNLVTQMKRDFTEYSNGQWDVEANVHLNNKGVKGRDTDKFLTISTYQALTNKRTKPEPEWFEQFDGIQVDEVHTAKSKSVKYIVDNCTCAMWRLGLTGTLDDCDVHEYVLKGMFGILKDVIETHELMAEGKVANLKIKVGVINHSEADRKFLRSAPRPDDDGKTKRKKASYKEEIDFICSHSKRNLMIMRLAHKLSGNTIIMINESEHGENLHKWLQNALPDRPVYLFTGAVDPTQRDEISKIMETESNAIIVGSLGVLSTGISIKRLHNLITARPIKSKVKVLQSIGRLLRLSKFGNDVTLYDIVDDFTIGAYTNYTYEHGQIRIGYYNQQKFDVEVSEIEL